MKQSEAAQHLREILFLYQKVRSNGTDPVFGIADEKQSPEALAITKALLIDIMPWVFDDQKCPIRALVRILDRVEEGEGLAPINYYNQMFVLYRFSPALPALAPLMGLSLPAEMPSMMTCMGGWDEEEERA